MTHKLRIKINSSCLEFYFIKIVKMQIKLFGIVDNWKLYWTMIQKKEQEQNEGARVSRSLQYGARSWLIMYDTLVLPWVDFLAIALPWNISWKISDTWLQLFKELCGIAIRKNHIVSAFETLSFKTKVFKLLLFFWISGSNSVFISDSLVISACVIFWEVLLDDAS